MLSANFAPSIKASPTVGSLSGETSVTVTYKHDAYTVSSITSEH